MKMEAFIIFVATLIVSGTWVFWYVNQPDPPACANNILTTNIIGCDIKGSAK